VTNPDLLFPYLLFCVVMTGSPGPNNAMALASGVRVGVRRSVPLVLGIASGVALMLAAIGLGLAVVFESVPVLHQALRIAGAAYLVWLAWRIATSGPVRTGPEAPAPLGFWGGILFQWVNPKAWAITTSAVAAYVPAEGYATGLAIAAVALGLVAVPCVGVWAAFGNALRRFLADPRKARWFNGAMALLLLASAIPVLVADHTD
jgi:threonine/homoserine/homoserine lactone efflux protein